MSYQLQYAPVVIDGKSRDKLVFLVDVNVIGKCEEIYSKLEFTETFISKLFKCTNQVFHILRINIKYYLDIVNKLIFANLKFSF